MVVMAWPHGGVLGQLVQNFGQAVVHGLCTARLKIGAATAIDQQGIAREDMRGLWGRQVKTHAASGVARCVQCLQSKTAKGQHLPIHQLNRCSADVTAFRGCSFNAKVLGQQTCAGNVIGVGMRF